MNYHRYISQMLEEASAARHEAPLYVERQVLNPDDLIRWALRVGYSLSDLDDPSTWHVTQVFSRTPIDWLGIAPQHNLINLPGVERREHVQFGDASVILLNSPQLQARWEEFARYGASWDFPNYQPHITLGKNLRQWADVPSFTGRVVLGPERYASLAID